MNYDQKEKIKNKMAKLAGYLLSNKITKHDILELCMDDPQFEINRDIVGKLINYFEWRVHPKHPQIECSTEGDIRVNGDILQPKTYKGNKVIKFVRGKKTIDINVASTVLSTYQPMPTDGKYIVGYRDEDPNNCRIQNLYWRKIGE